jgi:hypothetical protein
MEIVKYFRVQWDRTAAVIAAVGGVVALLLGYFGISETPHVAAQLPYIISGGLFGIFALGIASMAWISADLRDEWRELRALRQLLEEDRSLAGEAISGAPAGPGHGPASVTEDRDGQPGEHASESFLIDDGETSPRKSRGQAAGQSHTRTRPLKATPAPDETTDPTLGKRTPER